MSLIDSLVDLFFKSIPGDSPQERGTSRKPLPPMRNHNWPVVDGWVLGVIELENTGKNSPPSMLQKIYAAGRVIQSVGKGGELLNNLDGLKGKIKLVVFQDSELMRTRAWKLGEKQPGDEKVRGRTIPSTNILADGGKQIIKDNKERPKLLHVLVCIDPDIGSKKYFSLDDEVNDYLSNLNFTHTLFHELLHVWWIYKRADPDTLYETFTLYDVKIEEIADTGHEPNVTWEIKWDKENGSIKQEVVGTIEEEFLDKGRGFVDQVVKKYCLQATVQNIIKKWQKQ